LVTFEVFVSSDCTELDQRVMRDIM
jgi:hypothetical protein